jgi:hypothetical protein
MAKFIYIFPGGGIVVQPPPPPAEIGAHLAKWTAWVDGLVKAGHTEAPPGPLENGGKTVRGSSKTVTDGPYAEAKDLVSGFLMISADSLDAAVALARGCPIYEYDGSVEVPATRREGRCPSAPSPDAFARWMSSLDSTYLPGSPWIPQAFMSRTRAAAMFGLDR